MSLNLLSICALLALAGCAKSPDMGTPAWRLSAWSPISVAVAATAKAEPAPAEVGIEWQKGDVDAAFAAAKAANKPVFLYWGAVWCPPCQSGQSHDFQSPGFWRSLAVFCSRVSRRRYEERAKTRCALQGQWLSDDDPVQAGRDRDHPVARRGGRRPVHARAGVGNERRTTGEGHARRSARPCARRTFDRPKNGGCLPTIRGIPTSSRWCRRTRCRQRCSDWRRRVRRTNARRPPGSRSKRSPPPRMSAT